MEREVESPQTQVSMLVPFEFDFLRDFFIVAIEKLKPSVSAKSDI
jgi:hypothetical protein